MEYTTNLNLKKPDVNEYYNIEQENENKDLIDTAVGKLNSQVGTETLTTTAKNCTGAINELNKKSTDFLNNVSWNPEVVDVSKANTINGFKYGKFVYVTGEFWILDTFTNTWTGKIILYNTPKAMHMGQKINTQTNNISFSGFLPSINASDTECFSIYIRETPINGLPIQFGGFYISD